MDFKIYSKELHKRYGYRAAWLPNLNYKVGDYGSVIDGKFQLEGSVFDKLPKRFKLQLRKGNSTDYQFASKLGVSITPSARGKSSVASGILKIEFSHQEAFFFQAAGCSTNSVENYNELGQALLYLYENGYWDRSFKLITELVTCNQLIVVAAGANNGSIKLRVNAEVQANTLLEAKGKLSIVGEQNIGFQCISNNPCTPLFTLSHIRDSPLGKLVRKAPSFRPYGVDGPIFKEDIDNQEVMEFGVWTDLTDDN